MEDFKPFPMIREREKKVIPCIRKIRVEYDKNLRSIKSYAPIYLIRWFTVSQSFQKASTDVFHLLGNTRRRDTQVNCECLAVCCRLLIINLFTVLCDYW